MGKRGLFAVVAGLAILASGIGTSGAATTIGQSAQFVSATVNSYDPMTSYSRFGQLSVSMSVQESSSGTTVTPAVVTQAGGYEYDCSPVCVWTDYPFQTVAVTALSSGALDNTVQFSACLTPSPSGPCRMFDLTLSKPSGPLTVYGCGVLPACVSGWADPGSGSGALSASTYLGRWGYTLTGTFGGVPIVNANYAEGGSFRSISAGVNLP